MVLFQLFGVFRISHDLPPIVCWLNNNNDFIQFSLTKNPFHSFSIANKTIHFSIETHGDDWGTPMTYWYCGWWLGYPHGFLPQYETSIWVFPWGSPIYPFKIIDGFSLTKTNMFGVPSWPYIYIIFPWYSHNFLMLFLLRTYFHVYDISHGYCTFPCLWYPDIMYDAICLFNIAMERSTIFNR